MPEGMQARGNMTREPRFGSIMQTVCHHVEMTSRLRGRLASIEVRLIGEVPSDPKVSGDGPAGSGQFGELEGNLKTIQRDLEEIEGIIDRLDTEVPQG